jgi:ribulose-phosphate 3-epimerase
MSLIVPAVLPSSRKDLEEKLAIFTRIPGVSRIQIDVVDRHFAPIVSWPYSNPRELQTLIDQNQMLPALDRIEYEIDFMCLDVKRSADAWLKLGVTRLTFHAESAIDLPRLIMSSRDRYGDIVSFGLAINITSNLSLLQPCLKEIQYVQFMGIASIGTQGQLFDRRVFEKVREFHAHHPEVPMQVDGGVSLENAKQLLALGVSNLVVGSGILRANDPAAAFAELEALESSYGV